MLSLPTGTGKERIFAPEVMRYVAPGLYPAIVGSTPTGCIVISMLKFLLLYSLIKLCQNKYSQFRLLFIHTFCNNPIAYLIKLAPIPYKEVSFLCFCLCSIEIGNLLDKIRIFNICTRILYQRKHSFLSDSF